ncbi:conserved phage C-terminal domain-containing protein [Chryseobacterium arthrosphaerae]|uniref:Conserved phage C-terminal domain-containing protein n=1 Tax=Chryseobacterium arthrosphaerae TaxID=651561 RepID=A0ABU7R2V4_9FLAO
MSQLGYTWYPQDWWTSDTFKRLKRFPLVKYALRELFDLMYMSGKPIEMNREYLIDDFNIELTDQEYEKLLEYVVIDENGKWWNNSIRKRLSKAEAARENGKKGGRPAKTEVLNTEDSQLEKVDKKQENNVEEKTQKPSEKTQEENPQNPPLEIEKKYKYKENINIDFTSLLSFINKKTGRGFKVINEKVKKSYRARLKEGYTKVDILHAITNAAESDYHKGNGAQYLTPEFFSRSDTLDKYSEKENLTPATAIDEPQISGPWPS